MSFFLQFGSVEFGGVFFLGFFWLFLSGGGIFGIQKVSNNTGIV